MSTIKKLTLTILSVVCIGAFSTVALANVDIANADYAVAQTTSEITMKDGASIRANEPTGIRFVAYLSEDIVNTLCNVDADTNVVSYKDDANVFGMVVVPAAVLDSVGSKDPIDYICGEYGKTQSAIATTFSASQIYKFDGNYCVNGVIAEILDANYNYEYKAVAYFVSGGVRYYGEVSEARSIVFVADAALQAPNAEDTDVLVSMVTKAINLKNNNSLTIEGNQGDEINLQTKLFSSITATDLAFVSNNEDIVKVGENGIITLVGNGYTTVNVTAYGGKYNASVSVKVNKVMLSIETDVRTGVNFTSVLPEGKTFASASLNGDEVITENGVLALENTDAAAEPKIYEVTTTDGIKFDVNVTVWSMLIYNETDLRNANIYENISAEAFTNCSYSYFKLMDNISLTQDWTKSVQISAALANGNVPGRAFKGVFDGNNKVIFNFVVANEGNAGLIQNIGPGAVVKDLTLIGECKVCTSNQGGMLTSYTTGGTIENVTIEVKMASAGSDDNYSQASAGALLGTLGGVNASAGTTPTSITVKNCTIKSTATSTVYNSAGVAFVNAAFADSFKSMFVADSAWVTFENVDVVGFDNVMRIGTGSTATMLKKQADLSGLSIEGINVYTADEYEEKDYIKQTLDTDVMHGLDVASIIGSDENVISVTVDGESATLMEGVLPFENADASMTAKKIVVLSDKNTYVLTTTVYSALIYNEEDLRNAYKYENHYSTGYNFDRTDGYFKLMNSFALTQNWTADVAIGNTTGTQHQGSFGGVFDGNGKTISNFVVSNTANNALIKNIGPNAEVKNLTLIGECKVCTTNQGGLLTAYTTGGTITSITIKVKMANAGSSLEYTNASAGALLGSIGGGNANAKPASTITVKDCLVISTATGTVYNSALLGYNGAFEGDYSFISFENVSVVAPNGEAIIRNGKSKTSCATTVDGLIALGVSGISVYDNLASYEATLG